MHLQLELLAEQFAICRLAPSAAIPDWPAGEMISITRTGDELSIVCQQHVVPTEVHADRGWRCFRVAGQLDLSLVGVVAALTRALAEAGISVFVISSFDTDYLLVRETALTQAIEALRGAGHSVV